MMDYKKHRRYPSEAVIAKAREMVRDTMFDFNHPTIAGALLDVLLILEEGDDQQARIASLIDSMCGMDSADDARVARSAILSIEADHPGALWIVARNHPQAEVRACATFLATTLLMSDRKLVRQGVWDAVQAVRDEDHVS